jgi:hypothetical protein
MRRRAAEEARWPRQVAGRLVVMLQWNAAAICRLVHVKLSDATQSEIALFAGWE